MGLRHGPVATPIGELWVTVSSRGLVAVSRRPPDLGGGVPRGGVPRGGVPRGGGASAFDPQAVAGIAAQLEGYFAGRRRSFAVTLDDRGWSDFDVAVWRATMAVPYGSTVSYGELAALAGRPGAARAAGGAMARCPFFPVVPCHRVIAADGSLGGWGSDAWVKRWLLRFEGVRLR